jgi:hypothetical protein
VIEPVPVDGSADFAPIRLRVLFVGGSIQACFGTLWLVRSALAVGGAAGALGVLAGFGLGGALLALGLLGRRRVASWPSGSRTGAETAVLGATCAQLVASVALPSAVALGGYADLVVPSALLTAGPLLIWIGARFDIFIYRIVGAVLVLGPIAAALTLHGETMATTVGLAGAGLLLAAAGLGFAQAFAKLRAEGSPAPAGQ